MATKTFPETPPLTDVDRASALDLLQFHDRGLVHTLAHGAITFARARDLVRSHLFAHRIGTYRLNAIGEPSLRGIADGVLVRVDGRVGVLTWDEIVLEFFP